MPWITVVTFLLVGCTVTILLTRANSLVGYFSQGQIQADTFRFSLTLMYISSALAGLLYYWRSKRGKIDFDRYGILAVNILIFLSGVFLGIILGLLTYRVIAKNYQPSANWAVILINPAWLLFSSRIQEKPYLQVILLLSILTLIIGYFSASLSYIYFKYDY